MIRVSLKSLLLSVLFIHLAWLGFAQNDEIPEEKFSIELNLYAQEAQLTSFLFQNSLFFESPNFSYGISTSIGISLDKNWYTSLGLSYQRNNYNWLQPLEIEVPVLDPNVASSHDYQLTSSNSIADLNIDLIVEFDQTECVNSLLSEGDIIQMRLSTLNRIETLGIPLKAEKSIGKKPLKFYAELILHPKIRINQQIRYEGINRGGVRINDPDSRCVDRFGQTINRVHSNNSTLRVRNWNTSLRRVDGILGIGMLHQSLKNTFKLGIFYGESITWYSIVENERYALDIIGLKLEFRKTYYQ